MENTITSFKGRTLLKSKSKKSFEELEIIENLQNLTQALKETETYLNLVTDELIIDSLIYQNLSLKKKYDYYLRLCKDKGIVATGFDKIS